MKRFISGSFVAALLGLLAIPPGMPVSPGMAMASDVTIRSAVHTRSTGAPAPTSTLNLPMQIPSTLDLPVQISNTPSVTTVGWRHYAYRPYVYPVYRPLVYAPYVAAYPPYYNPYVPYYGYGAGVYAPLRPVPYAGPAGYGYRGRYRW